MRSNYGAFLDEQTVGWMKETPVDTPLEEMRRRFDEDGYVWVKNVMPREDVLDMRQAYFVRLSRPKNGEQNGHWVLTATRSTLRTLES